MNPNTQTNLFSQKQSVSILKKDQWTVIVLGFLRTCHFPSFISADSVSHGGRAGVSLHRLPVTVPSQGFPLCACIAPRSLCRLRREEELTLQSFIFCVKAGAWSLKLKMTERTASTKTSLICQMGSKVSTCTALCSVSQVILVLRALEPLKWNQLACRKAYTFF